MVAETQNQKKAMDNYYYAVGGQQQGPISESQLDQLVSTGQISSDTLIWKEGMANWEPYSRVRSNVLSASVPPVATPLPGSSPVPPDAAVCGVCKQIFPKSEVIQYGTVAVCSGCKPAFVQSLKEGVVSTGALNYATFGQRFLAILVDSLLIFAAMFVLGMGLAGAGLFGQGESPAAGVLINLGASVISILFKTLFLTKFGATPGKMLLGLKVVTPDGGPLSFGKALGRSAMEIVSGMVCYIGYIMAGFDEERRALHDRVAGTRVIKIKK